MKILQFSDLHIGSRPDIKSYYENELTQIIDIIHKRNVDIIVMGGDLYDKKISTNSDFNTYTNLFINTIANYCRTSGAYFYLIKGTMSHDYNQLDSFLYLTKDPSYNTYIINTCQDIYVKNMHILFVPEEYENSKKDYYKEYLYGTKRYDMAFGHGMFTFAGGYATESGKPNHIVFEAKEFDDIVYGLTIFGHIHTKMRKGRCLYSGSYSRDSFGEEEPKGCTYVEYDEKHKKVIIETFIENRHAPIYKTINARNIPDTQCGVFIANELKKVFRLRIVIDSDITEEKFNDLKALTYDNEQLVLYKRMRGLSKKEDDQKNKELEKRRIERRSLISKYAQMDFIEITKTYAKTKYNEDYTTEDIKEAIG